MLAAFLSRQRVHDKASHDRAMAASEAYGRLPSYFERIGGPDAQDVRFLARVPA